MQLIEIEPIEDGAVTLQFSREEFHLVRDVLREAIDYFKENLHKDKEEVEQLKSENQENITPFEKALDEESLAELGRSIKQTEKLLAKANTFREAIEKIVSENDLARYY